LFQKYNDLKKEVDKKSIEQQTKETQEYVQENPGHKQWNVVSDLTNSLIERIKSKYGGQVYINQISFYQAVATLIREGHIHYIEGYFYQTCGR
jgi:hypothetical protein